MREKKRSEPNSRDIKRYINIFKKYPKCLIFNMDEAAWNFVYKNGQVGQRRSKRPNP